jgi:hypothetical protein
MPVRSPSILPMLLALALVALGAAPAQSVPSPPTERADRFGVYHWGTDISTWTGSPNRLAWGADKVAAIGSRTIRIYMGPADSYHVNPPTNQPGDLYLQRIAASPAYDALFRDPRFRTYLLTVSTSTGTAPSIAAVRKQIARLGEYLLSQAAYTGKTFILLNWEGDNAVGAAPPGSPKWDDLIGRTQARADGVRDARSRQPGSSTQLYSGLEFNLVERDGVRCGDGEVRCVIDTVAPRVTVDYYSYSAWQSLNVKREQPAASLAKTLRNDLGFALAKVRSRRPQVREENFILGEWGFARSLYSECLAASYVEELVLALEGPHGFHLSYAIYWQTLDVGWRSGRRTPCVGDLRDEGDPEGQVDWLLYGLFRGRDATMTLPGSTLQALLRGQPAPPLPRCPSIDPQGIADPASASLFLHSGDPITIAGGGFGHRGNEVLVLQAHDRRDSGAPNVLLELGAKGDPGWLESPQQITATLPAKGLHDGCALVWISTGNGVESNAILVRIQPD